MDNDKAKAVMGLTLFAALAAAAGSREHQQLKRALKRLNQFELSVADAVAGSLPKTAEVAEVTDAAPAFGLANSRFGWGRQQGQRDKRQSRRGWGRQALGGYDGDAEWLDDNADCGCAS
jgi:diphthamide synthase (EF-2-diphthine--ammonia ligase)